MEKHLIEPSVASIPADERDCADREGVIQLSIAVSLKRIADLLEKLELGKDVALQAQRSASRPPPSHQRVF